MSESCAVSGCGATSADFGTFLFPETGDRRWSRSPRKPPDGRHQSFICWSHFDEKDLVRAGTEFRRKVDAVPSKFLGREYTVKDLDLNFCRFCAAVLSGDSRGNYLNEMNRSVDSKRFLDFLLPDGIDESFSELACDECFVQTKLTMRFIRNCAKASQELEKMAKIRSTIRAGIQPKHEVKAEMDEYGEIPIGFVEPEVKMEISSLGGFSDRDCASSDDDDNLPLATRLKKDTELKCAHCSFSCSKRVQLNNHMKKHRNEVGPFQCTQCDFNCKKPNQLATHNNKKHKTIVQKTEVGKEDCIDEVKPPVLKVDGENSSEEPAKLQCPECPYSCERLVQMASHKKKHTNKKPRKQNYTVPKVRKVNDMYVCEFCDFQCKDLRQMAGHRSSHSNMIKKSHPSGKERNHMCPVCGKILATRGSYFSHMKYHNDQRDYSCKHCDKKFYSKRDMDMHVESFHEKKKFECEICGIKCTWKNALSKHMRKHDASSFKHECSYCGKKFIAANELRLHVWRHTGQTLSCDICGAGYRFNFLLTQHKIKEHGVQIDGVKLYKRFQKGKPSGNPARKRVQQIDPTTAAHQPVEQNHELSSSSYSSDVAGQYPGHSSNVSNLQFHPVGSSLGRQPMPSAQVESFGQVGHF